MPFASINDAKLWYQIRGSGKPVLLHPGYTASRAHWEPVAKRLETDFQVVLMESRGTGESEHTDGGYNFAQYAADVVGLADHLGLQRFTFAGHSMGGGIGFTLALEYAERLDGLVLMASVPADGTTVSNPALRERARESRRARDRKGMFAMHRTLQFRPEVETDEWFNLRIDLVIGASEGHYEDSAAAMQSLRLGDRLQDIDTPTLVIAGAVDGLLEANLIDFARLPNATLQVFSFAGHEVALHEPEGVAQAIKNLMIHGPIRAEALMGRLRE